MVLRAVAGVGAVARKGEDAADLRGWLKALPGAPTIHETVLLGCPQHGDERPTWSYVEADPTAGVARRRCLACGHSVALLDSEQRWTHPQMFACDSCGHSIAEVAAGLSTPDGEHVRWVVLGARCVECGRLSGLTDAVVDDLPLAEVLAGL